MADLKDSEIAAQILIEKRADEHASQAAQLAQEYQEMVMKLARFMKSGASPEQMKTMNPLDYLNNVLTAYAMRKLQNRIHAPN